MRNRSKKFLSIMMTIMIIISSMGFPVATAETVDPPTVEKHVVISQIYGGSSSSTTFTHDFIELYNPTDKVVDLTGWSVQYASDTGNFSGITPLNGSIEPNAYYLIQEAGLSTGSNLPTLSATGSINLSGSKGKVALVNNVTANTGIFEPTIDPDVIDFVGYGSATMFEGTGAAPAPSASTSIIRIDVNVDNNDNKTDFKTATPIPRVGVQIPETKCSVVTSNVASGRVFSGTTVTFAASTEGASIEYNTTAPDAAEWTVGSVITITKSTTVYARAVKAGLDNGDVTTFQYTVNDIDSGTILEAKNAPVGTENIYVKGIVTYINGKNVYIQDSTGAICLYLTTTPTKIKLNDEVAAIGKREDFNNLIELTNVNELVLKVNSSGNAIPDLGIAKISDLIAKPDGKTLGFIHMCEIIKVSGATLVDTSTISQGESKLTLNPAIDFAKYFVAANDLVDVTIRMNDNNGALQAEVM